MNLRSIFFILILFVSPAAFSASHTYLGDSGVLIEAGSDIHFTDLTDRFTHPAVFHTSVSFALWQEITLGMRYSYWLADQNDTLKFQELLGQIGYQFGNPRVRYRILAGIGFPLDLRILQNGSTASTFSSTKDPIVFDARFQLILKFSPTFSGWLETGYRWANLGVFKSGTQDYIASGAAFDLSGPFLGTGLGIHF